LVGRADGIYVSDSYHDSLMRRGMGSGKGEEELTTICLPGAASAFAKAMADETADESHEEDTNATNGESTTIRRR
jgi:hypothetical protein